MNDTYEEVLKLAAQLGEAIRRHQRYVKLRETDEQVRNDKSATDALEAYNRAAEDAARKERSGQPIEVEDKRRLRALQETVAGNASVKVFMAAQADYAELMRKMNDAIYQAIAVEEGGGTVEAP
ncbi:MAG: YlbF family regulator [Planctomycetota bacterium]|nr:YlbF family regulator [Planctomycetota bacterium]